MKKLAIYTLGLAALAAASPAFAASGFAGGGYVRGETEAGPFESEGDGFDVSGAVAFGGSGGLGVELDAGYSDIEDSDTLGVVGHLFNNTTDYRLGGFVGIADVEDETVLSFGGEGLFYFRDVTLGAAIGYADADDTDADAYGLDGELRFFANENFRLDGRLGWASIDAGVADDDAFSLGVGAEYQFAAAPVSLFGGYDRTEFDTFDVETNAFRVGLRYNWGGSLKERDRTGAGLAGLSSLSRALGVS